MPRLDMMSIQLASRAVRRLPIRGRGRVGAYLYQHMTPPEKEIWSIPMRGGYKIHAPAASRQSWIAAFTGAYDAEITSYLERFIDVRSTILDIGASLGFYTIPLARAAQRRDARVIAIEPVRDNCSTLRRNVELNRLSETVTIIQAALGKDCGHVTLHVEAGGSGNAAVVSGLSHEQSTLHDQVGRLTATEEARLVTLDSVALLWDGDGSCSLIKMDVEGFEPDVLAGARRLIESSRPIIVGEFNPAWLQSRGLDAQVAAEWAKVNGYRCFELALRRKNVLTDSSTVEITPVMDERRDGGDLILFPRDRLPDLTN